MPNSDPAFDGEGSPRWRFEAHHIFPHEIFNDDELRSLVESAGIFRESRVNKLGLLTDPDAVARLQNLPSEVLSAITSDGKIGTGQHVFHPKYNAALKDELNRIKMSNSSAEQNKGQIELRR